MAGFGFGLGFGAGVMRRSGGTPTPTPTTPTQITDLLATPGDGQATLAWAAPGDGGSAITDYTVQYKLTSSGTWLTFADSVSPVPGATVTGLTNGSAYDFRAAAVNAIGTGPWSDVATATPAGAAASIMSGAVLRWSPTGLAAMGLADGAALSASWLDDAEACPAVPSATPLGALPTMKTNGLNGYPVARFTGGKCYLDVGRPATLVSALNEAETDRGYTILMLVRVDAAATGNFRMIWSPAESTSNRAIYAGTAVVGQGPRGAWAAGAGWRFLTVRSRNRDAASFVGLNGQGMTTNYATIHPTAGYLIGRGVTTESSSSGFIGDVAEVAVFNRFLTMTDIAKAIKELCAKYALPLPWAGMDMFSIFAGDSNTYNNNTTRESWPAVLMQQKGVPNDWWANLAISGMFASWEAKNAIDDYTGLEAELGVPVAYTLAAYGNETAGTGNNLAMERVRAAGVSAIMSMVGDDYGYAGAPTDATRQNFINVVTTAGRYDVLCPEQLDIRIGVAGTCPPSPAPLNPLWESDRRHLSVAGHAVRANIASSYYDALRAIALGAAAPAAPAFTTAPAITGTAKVGQKVTSSVGVYARGFPSGIQWAKDGAPISGAPLLDYTLTSAESGGSITAKISLTGPGGSASSTSAPVGPVVA